ncbi:glucosamine-fructose-6-phosphate aminotransferase [Cryptosporidium parvum Iowa II]|uniref:Glutamine--fructose-6-phosphate aminotransferase [isomerizing] n=1 Tax=Cryptosporidium parvum (strain Iowa II) TaxID=353152 RepID=Q5CS83_CRYPI|nr:glucosamine-fructose-6-phosphate aminotransferase [Cryptosporidium parvum Iowa II]EAK88288.1 glucosamine-fructose-6-phosphate aminotransferase [Cryptosporidium parvum Iowa II]WRK30773.1 Glucosamine-fructose-6-phosphate aminotransferase/Sugar isomerase (SIS) [Cryptosporidium parvum]
MNFSSKYKFLVPIVNRINDDLKEKNEKSKFYRFERLTKTMKDEQKLDFLRGSRIFGMISESIGSLCKTGRKNSIFSVPNKAYCCGIIGYIGSGDAQKVLMQGIEILQNRGYDSCGMSTIDDQGELITTKYSSKESGDSIERLKNDSELLHGNHHIGIAHTRWATHGGKTDFNAHPHQDYKKRISIVHNGTIDNYCSLKSELMEKGIKFQSETDTEVIANLIGSYLDDGEDFQNAVQKALSRLQGTWGIAVLHKDYKDLMILARHGSPLLVGVQSGHIYIASETSALANYTNQYVALQDGEIALLSHEGINKLITPSRLLSIDHEKVESSPSPYLHWTLKEIYDQPHALARSLNFGGRISPYNNMVKLGGLDQRLDELKNVQNMILLGCGTSFHAALFAQLLMEHISGFNTVSAKDASEIFVTGFPREHAGAIAISQSGETADTVKAINIADKLGIPKISVVNVVGSMLARTTGCGVYLNAGREVAVASTKAFSTQVLVLSLIAAWFAQNRDSVISQRCQELLEAIHRVPISVGVSLQAKDQCEQIAEMIKDNNSIFVLGKGYGYPVALEGALKIKEISYIHSEGYSAGALKHGPFALIDKDSQTPVILVILSDENQSLMMNVAQQVKARGARVICITDDENLCKDIDCEKVLIPSNGPLTALNAVIPLQLIAYYLAIKRGINPDKPRGLAKAVTVF